MSRILAVVAVLVMFTGCSSHYQPRPGPRISQVLKDGQITYVRDGVAYPHGLFGTGLVKAVQGNRRAEHAARTYHQRGVRGLISYLLTSACAVVGSVTWTAAVVEGDDDLALVGGGVAIGCAVGMFVSLGYMVSGIGYRDDAVNMYNDDIEAAPPQQWRGAPGRWGANQPDKPATVTSKGDPRANRDKRSPR